MWPFKRKNKSSTMVPPGFKAIKDAPDENIQAELHALPILMVPAGEEMIRGASLWLSMIQDTPEVYGPAEPAIIAEIRALDEYMNSRGKVETGGIPSFFAYMYYMMVWHNTIKFNGDYQKFAEIANSLSLPSDDKERKGYA